MTGGLVAIIPIRSLTGGKTRLAGVVPASERQELTRRMLLGVIRAAQESGAIEATAVVSPDPAILTFVAALGTGIFAVPQPSTAPGLNAAIDLGRTWAETQGASGIVVLFGDLPLLTSLDVQNLVRRDAPVVLAPDRHGAGTNALLLRFGRTGQGRLFTFSFGTDSYIAHLNEASRLELETATSITPGTALDLDTPDDLRLLGWNSESPSIESAVDDHITLEAKCV